jgi:hypothetical protein
VTDVHPNPGLRWKNRRWMAWLSMALGGFVVPALTLGGADLTSISGELYTFLALPIVLYSGGATWENVAEVMRGRGTTSHGGSY